MLDAAARELDRMRRSATTWHELACENDSGGHDRKAVKRAKVLWAPQYDHRPGDLPLVRWLARQEAVCRREAPFQGLTEETELAGFLLATHRRVEDVWLHWDITRANFDTFRGYDREHLVAAGIRETVAFAGKTDHADRHEVLGLLLSEDGTPHTTEDDLAAWLSAKRRRFPSDPALEDPFTWVERAMLAGDRNLALCWLDCWAQGRPRNDATLSRLGHWLSDLGAFAEAAAVTRERLPLVTGAWDSASVHQTLARLEREAGAHDAAWEALRECHRLLGDIPGLAGSRPRQGVRAATVPAGGLGRAAAWPPRTRRGGRARRGGAETATRGVGSRRGRGLAARRCRENRALPESA
ncbi:hypothetical protein ABZ639_11305 [Saccharomonospora sp. NPDC006951]